MRGSAELVSRLLSVDDRTPLIVEGALTASCQVCVKTLDLFLRILGREGANLVMKLYATGGLFLGGGILPRLVGTTSLVPFLKAFHFPGPMEPLLASTPIYVILRPDAALLGTASHGKQMLF
jgi:glucokinase